MKLQDIAQINPPKPRLNMTDESMEVSFVPMTDLSINSSHFWPKETRKISEVGASYTYFADNDVLLARVTPCFENGKAGVAKQLKNGIGFGSSEYYVLRSDQLKILPDYLYLNISSNRTKSMGKSMMTGTGGLQRIPKMFIENLEMPLPPLEIQNQIVKEFSIEQEIIESNKKLITIYEEKIHQSLAEV